MRKNKIKLVVFLPKFVFSGAGNSVFSFINYLSTKNYDISIICLGKCEYKGLFKKKLKYFELPKNSLFSSFFKILSIIKKISKNSSKTIIYSNHHYANIYAIIIRLILKNTKVICIERTCIYELSKYYSFVDFIKKNIIKYLVKILYKKADKIISNTKYTKREICEFSKKNTFQVYPPSLKKIFNYKKKKIKKFIILWVGRLDKEKGLDAFLHIIHKINFKSEICILGNGKEYNKLVNLYKNLKRNHFIKIKFMRYVKNTQKFYAKSHILINTSHFEGSNNSIIEAFNNNLCVIGSNSPGGNREIISDSRLGLLYNLNVHLDLLKKINFMKKNYYKIHSQLKNKKYFLKKFQENYSHSKTFNILKKV